MKEPLLSDQAFLDDVEGGYRQSGDLHVWWLGQSGFLLSHMEDFLAFDPYLSDSLTLKYAGTDKPHTRITRRVVDPAELNFVFAVFSSHSHTDHLDADTLRPMLRDNPSAQVIAPGANLEIVSERTGRPAADLWGMNDDGQDVVFGPFRITAVAAAHNTIDRDEHGRCKYLGYVVRFGRWTIYHSGDTKRYDGMAELLRPFNVDVALLPINGDRPERRVAGNLSGKEAAQLARDIGAKLVIPCHYDMFEFNTADPAEEFVPECERLGQAYRVLRQGERWSSTELQ